MLLYPMIIIPKNVNASVSDFLLQDAIKYCETDNASEIYNIAGLGENEYRIMYYIGELPNRKMKAIIRKIPFQ
jgi:hypothetical protein